MQPTPIHRALISVSDKTGIVEFAQALNELGVHILSTGGTAQLLRAHQLDVTDIADYTHFPEMMGGRLKTLHPKVHGALLGRADQDAEVMAEHNITPIDLLVVNLYPFAKTISDPHCDLASAIEQIDIGGPTMLRAAAKNYQRVTVVSDTTDYGRIINELKDNDGYTNETTRFQLACKAFALTAEFDAQVANYLQRTAHPEKQLNAFPERFTLQFEKKTDLRYGENPHQKSAFYKEHAIQENGIASAHLVQGKPLSYNNISDADAALECVRNFTDEHACVIVKHANPCGVAVAKDQFNAYLQAFHCDPTSAFGGIIAFNKPLCALTAQKIIDNQFVEVIVVPDLDQKVRDILAQKPNIRVLTTGELSPNQPGHYHYQRVNGGLLVQDRDIQLFNSDQWHVVTQSKPSKKELADCQFAWIVAKYVKSNAIVFAKDKSTLGIGAGQMSRVDSTKIATRKATEAGLTVAGAVMASDAFFPFRDAIDTAAHAGIKAIIQPGGSIRDMEVIAAADEAGIAMIFTGMRHFKH